MRLRSSVAREPQQAPVVGTTSPSITALRDLLPLLRDKTRDRPSGASLNVVFGVDANIETASIVADLAILAVESGLATLLVDADLDNPAQHALFDVDKSAGVSDVLAGEAGIADVVRPTPSGVSLITAGRQTLHAAAAFDATMLADRLLTLSDQFDLILLDARSAAPLNAAPMAANCDHALIVVRRHKTSTRALQALLSKIEPELAMPPLVVIADPQAADE